VASYLCIERPLRAWRWTPLLSMFVAVGIAFWIQFLKASSKVYAGGPQLIAGFAPLTVRGPLYSVNQKSTSPSGDDKYRNVQFVLPESRPDLTEGIRRRYGKDALDVMVLGDSHSLMFAPQIDDILRTLKLSGTFFCADAIAPDLFRDSYLPNEHFGTLGQIQEYDQARRRILEVKSPKVVVWIQRYDGRRFDEVRASIEFILRRSACVFVQQPPVLNIGDRCTLDVFGYYKNVAGKALSELRIMEKRQTRAQRERFEQELLACFKVDARFTWFETNKELTSLDCRTRWWDGKEKLFYLDDDHLSEYGVQLFRKRLEEAILKALALDLDHPDQSLAVEDSGPKNDAWALGADKVHKTRSSHHAP
jgi:hypothetical protein